MSGIYRQAMKLYLRDMNNADIMRLDKICNACFNCDTGRIVVEAYDADPINQFDVGIITMKFPV